MATSSTSGNTETEKIAMSTKNGNDSEIAKQESDAARRERGYLESEKTATKTVEETAHEMPERDD